MGEEGLYIDSTHWHSPKRIVKDEGEVHIVVEEYDGRALNRIRFSEEQFMKMVNAFTPSDDDEDDEEEETCFDFGDGPVPAHQHINGGGWVADSAYVSETAYVGPEARVFGNAQVSGKARVFGEAWILGKAQVYGETRVYGKARVFGKARVCDKAWVCGEALVCGNTWVYRGVTCA